MVGRCEVIAAWSERASRESLGNVAQGTRGVDTFVKCLLIVYLSS